MLAVAAASLAVVQCGQDQGINLLVDSNFTESFEATFEFSKIYPANNKSLHFDDEAKKNIMDFKSAEQSQQFDKKFKERMESLDKERMKRNGTTPKNATELIQYKRKNQHKHLTVHLVPHTHDDVGWLKTYEEYFLGMHNGNAHANVHQILDEVVLQLQMDPSRTFTYVEMKYFHMWYTRLSPYRKEQVKKLIKSGQLEITQGGWVANDEACTNYEDIIMQMYIGHQFLKKEFGVVPRVGWMIDAFGHSVTNAALFADFGFDAIYFSRIDDPERYKWESKEHRHMTFLWRPFSKSMGVQKEILAGVYNRDDYDYPFNFKLDERKDDDVPIQADPTLMDYNGKVKATAMINYAQEMIDMRANDEHVMILMGDDFTFMNAYQNYNELEKLIRIGNDIQEVNMTFVMSTPSRFTDALKSEKVKWPVKEDDIFPYMENSLFWTGYYSSRPALKKHVKDASAFFNAEQNVFARMQIDQNTSQQLAKQINDASFYFNDALGVLQHHDAITGTEVQYVAMDYQWRLYKRMQGSVKPYKQWLADKLVKDTGITVKNSTNDLVQCVGSQNDTVLDCPVNDHQNQNEFIVAIHNSRPTNSYDDFARIILPGPNYKAQIWSPQDNAWLDVVSDIIEQKHWRKNSTQWSDYQLFFKLKDTSALMTYVKITKISKEAAEQKQSLAEKDGNIDLDRSLSIKGFSEEGEILFQYNHKSQGIEQTFGMNLKKYNAMQQKNRDINRQFVDFANLTEAEQASEGFGNAEGAYIFRPQWADPLPHQYGKLDQDVTYQKGNLLEQWTIVYDNSNGGPQVPGRYEQAIIKVRFSETFQEIIEFEVELNPVPVHDDLQGKDIIVTWKMFDGFNANKTFWTDANGLEMQQRHFNKFHHKMKMFENQTLTFNDIGGNYYPVPFAISMRDFSNNSNLQVTIMNDRAQGGSADLHDNSTIELMQNRVLIVDDQKGVIEVLNETDADQIGLRITAKYYMQIFDTVKGASVQRQRQLSAQSPLQYFFIFNYEAAPDSFAAEASNPSPISLHAVENSTIQYRLLPVGKNIIRARFENLADRFDDNWESFKIDIAQFARELYQDVNKAPPKSVDITEMSLTANQPKKAMVARKIKWQARSLPPPFSSKISTIVKGGASADGSQVYDFEPLRIRQFEIVYNKAGKAVATPKQKGANGLNLSEQTEPVMFED